MMPGNDGPTVGNRPAATVVESSLADPSTEEGLASALSAFLAQLHASLGDPLAPAPVEPAADWPLAHPASFVPPASNEPRPRPQGAAPLPRRASLRPASAGPTVFGTEATNPGPLAWPAQPAHPPVLGRRAEVDVRGLPPTPLRTPRPVLDLHDHLAAPMAPVLVPTRAPRPPAPATPAVAVPPAEGLAVLRGPSSATAAAAGSGTPPGQAAQGAPVARTAGAAPAARTARAAPAALATGPGTIHPQPPGASTVRLPRWAAVAAASTVVALVAGLGLSLAWGHAKAESLSQRAQQLTAVESGLAAAQNGLASTKDGLVVTRSGLAAARSNLAVTRSNLAVTRSNLAVTRSSLAAAQQEAALQSANARHLSAQLAATGTLLSATKVELSRAQAELFGTERRLAEAQSRTGQAQSDLGTTQQALAAAQSRAARCQEGAVLGEQAVGLLSSLLVLNRGYLNAARAGDTRQMQQDASQMSVQERQARALGAEFGASAGTCAAAG